MKLPFTEISITPIEVFFISIPPLILIYILYGTFFNKGETNDEVDDGLIFDPESGAYITLEQAEEGYKLEDLDSEMILGAEDLHPEYIEYTKVKEYIDLNSFPELEEFDLYPFENFISKKTNFNHCIEFKLQKIKQIRPGIFLGLGMVVYQYSEGRQYEESDVEYQLIGFAYPELKAQSEKDLFNKHITQKLDSLDIELNYLANEVILCFKHSEPVTFEVFKKVEKCLLGDS